MKKYPSLLLFITLTACSGEKEAPENIFQKISSNKGITSADIDKMMKELENQEGTATIKADEAHMQITFPVTKVKQKAIISIVNDKEVETDQISANMQNVEHDNLAYEINYTYLPYIKTEKQIKELYDEQRDYYISAMNAKIEFETIEEYNGVKGRHLYMTIDESNWKANTKLFFKNNYLFRLTVVTPKGKLFNKHINRFFSSLKF